jgi:hypothetical protein
MLVAVALVKLIAPHMATPENFRSALLKMKSDRHGRRSPKAVDCHERRMLSLFFLAKVRVALLINSHAIPKV